MSKYKATYNEVKCFIEIESDSGCKLISKKRVVGEKLIIKCSCGEIFKTTYSNFRKQQRQCVKCGLMNKKMKLKKTNEQFLNEINSVYGGEYTLLDNYKDSNTKVKIKHNTCNNIFDVRPNDFINKKSKCPVCSNKVIISGVNDILTTHPDAAQLIVDKNLITTISAGSKRKVQVRCPICERIKKMHVYTLVKKGGVVCNMCGDGFSVPEKIMSSILTQVGLNYKWDNIFKWSKGKRYDFYIPTLSCIIETHGAQHYTDVPSWGQTLVKTQSIDKYKQQLAKDNNIKQYIIIDCRNSDIEFIKYNIMNSELATLIDLSCIDWDICATDALSNFAMKSISLYNNGLSVKEIADELKTTTRTIVGYLKRGNNLGFCEYSKEKSKLDGIKRKSKKVVCLNTEQVFNSIKSASGFYGVQIANCLGNRQKTAGVHPNTGERLQWMYYNDYIKQIGGDFYE